MIKEAHPLGLLIDSVALFQSPVYNYSYPEIQRLIPPQFINFRWESDRKRAYADWQSHPDGGSTTVDMRDVDVSEIISWAAELDARPFTEPPVAPGVKNTREDDVRELGEDLAEDRHESLGGLYKLLEWVPLKRWIYVESEDTRRDTRKLKRVLVAILCLPANVLLMFLLALTRADRDRYYIRSVSTAPSCTSLPTNDTPMV
jgi:hypothetical protein